MNISILFALPALFLSITLQSQVQHSPGLYYGRYEGRIGENATCSANLLRSFNQVSGNIQYEVTDVETGHIVQDIFVVTGSGNNDSVNMKAFNQKNASVKGLLTPDQFSGKWTTNENQAIDFVLNVNYPPGSMALDVSYLRSENTLAPKVKDSPSASIELTLLFPKRGHSQQAVADSVLKTIKSSFFGEGLVASVPDSMLMAFEKEFYKNYREQNAQWLENGGHSFSWEKQIGMGVTYNSNNVLCLEFERYAYTGGAHGMSNTSYRIVNLKDGTPITYQDVFIEGADSLLSQLLTKKLRNDFEIPDDTLLKQAGFFVDRIMPNHNLYINSNGIGFVYNSYEIAPYSFGATHLFLEFKQVDLLIKPTSPVYKLAHPVL
ncbi:MAG: DUF3298 domain-containing protein [Bacteroidales bacterium]|jgi:hypothetical protein